MASFVAVLLVLALGHRWSATASWFTSDKTCSERHGTPWFVERLGIDCDRLTPIEYCRSVRIARARELLEGGDCSQKQIAQSLGYKDVASFARVFRKALGEAPGAYRKRFGRNNISPADFAVKDRWKKHPFEAGPHMG
jgi:AraC-like DNA-binding protein